MRHTIQTIERLANRGAEMPQDLCFSEKLLFLSLRKLHDNRNRRLINVETFERERRLIEKDFTVSIFKEELYAENAKMTNLFCTLLTSMSKNGCALCKQAAAVFEGRISE